MAVFNYQAKTVTGEPRQGTVDAPSMESAIDILQRNNLIIINVNPVARSVGFIKDGRIKFFDRVVLREIVVLSRQLATLFEAKVPVIQALKTLVSQSSSYPLKEAMAEILDDVNGGSSLSLALSRHPKIFSRFYISMVKSGEESGKLQEVFSYLADYLDRSYNLTLKARNALIYPAFVFVSFIGVVTVMLVVVIPKLTSIFEQTGQAVPLYTQVVIGASYFLRSWGWLLLIVIAAGAFALWRYVRTERGQLAFDTFKIKVPILGPIYEKIYLARFADNLASLVVAGIPILRALQITSEVVGNKVYEAAILAAAESVKGGSMIANSFESSHVIPLLVTQMIKIGEESGKLDQILASIAKFYQREVDNLLDNLVSLIEPALIIFLGIAVGGLVASILVPLYNLSSAL